MNHEAFFKISYGLYIISAAHNGKKNGYIGNTSFQVTADPSQLAISCHKDNLTTDMIRQSGCFSMSVLKQEAKSELIGLFGYQSGKDVDKFKSVAHKTASTGAPIVLDDSLAWFDCKVVNEFDVGTHVIFIGEIMENELIDKYGKPLTYEYYRDEKKGLAPKNAPTYVEKAHEEKAEEKMKSGDKALKKFKCVICAYVYDPEKGDPSLNIPPGTSFEDLPDDYECPICGAGTDMFEEN